MNVDHYDELKQRVLARGPALADPVTEDELVDDLGRLLREGLVAVVVDDVDDDLKARFQITARGQHVRLDDVVVAEPQP